MWLNYTLLAGCIAAFIWQWRKFVAEMMED
jgi:hypothetical protein